MDWITNPEIWISLLTLTVLEIVLGIDNIVFISILAGKLPENQQAKARQTGLMLALVTRVLLLCGLAYMVKLTAAGRFRRWEFAATSGLGPRPDSDSRRPVSALKSTHEIHDKLEGEMATLHARRANFTGVIIQIRCSTSCSRWIRLSPRWHGQIPGRHDYRRHHRPIFALIFAGRISDFIHKHPS
jgi:predicted tellurium resistance membrane protein TerC